MEHKRKILFLCVGNSCRSQMAQGLLDKLGGDRFAAYSAGSDPAGYVHPFAISTMKEIGIDISGNVSKSLFQYVGEPWNFIITVCDDEIEACPVFPGQPITAHWGFEDPAKFVGGEAETRQFFREIARQIERRIQLFLALPEEKLSALEYEKAVKKIGNQ